VVELQAEARTQLAGAVRRRLRGQRGGGAAGRGGGAGGQAAADARCSSGAATAASARARDHHRRGYPVGRPVRAGSAATPPWCVACPIRRRSSAPASPACMRMPRSNAEQRALAESILGAVGATLWVPEESLLDPVTAISGSGPAYVLYFIEAVQQAAQEMGFSATDAKKLAVETFVGTARLAAQSAESAAVLPRARHLQGGDDRACACQHGYRPGKGPDRAGAARSQPARARTGEQLGADE